MSTLVLLFHNLAIRSTANTAQPPPGIDWIPDLDEIDSTYTMISFRHTMLDQLPPEVLEIVTKYLDPGTLLVVAPVNSKLRAVAERQLYREIAIPRACDTSDGTGSRGYLYHPLSSERMNQLYRTLLARPDLADRVKQVTLSISSEKVSIEVPRESVFPGALSSASNITISVNEEDIAEALLQQLRLVEHMNVLILKPYGLDFLPGIDSNIARATAMGGLQKLKSLEWDGSDLDWTSIKNLSSLQHLHLIWPSAVSSNSASEETHDSLNSLHLSYSSSIFTRETRYTAYLGAFLPHLTSLRSIRLEIDNTSSMEWFRAQNGVEGRLTLLLDCLAGVAAILKDLSITMADEQTDGWTSWIDHILPSTFSDFSCLETLNVPYTFLFGPGNHGNVPTIGGLLPASLRTLQVYCPSVVFLDMLNGLWCHRNELPALAVIEIECSNDGGDTYNIFAFDNHSHPAVASLSSMGIELNMSFRKGHWNSDWDDYDIRALDMDAWQVSFGPPVSGKDTMNYTARSRH